MVLDGVNLLFGGMICWPDQPGPPQAAQMAIAVDISRLFLNGYAAGPHAPRPTPGSGGMARCNS